jgi:hypothetical protein
LSSVSNGIIASSAGTKGGTTYAVTVGKSVSSASPAATHPAATSTAIKDWARANIASSRASICAANGCPEVFHK